MENKLIKEHIARIFIESKGIYGAPKIHEIIKKEKLLEKPPSLKRVQRLMKNLGLFAKTIKKFKPKKSRACDLELPNYLKGDFKAFKINTKWVADITYIHTIKDGWCYLASVMDLCSHKIVGYSFSKSIDKSIVIKALKKALTNQGNPKNVIIHTDRGSQYLSKDYINLVESSDCIRSYSAKGNPYDNACIESFHAILKKEEVYRKVYLTFEEANTELFKFIEGWYNRKRIHSSIEYLTPQEFEILAA